MNKRAVNRLVKDLEAIQQAHDEGDGCYGLGADKRCPTCEALRLFKESISREDSATKLAELWIDRRVVGTLKSYGVETLNDLEELTRYEVATMRQLGPKGLASVLAVMAEHGKALKGESIGA